MRQRQCIRHTPHLYFLSRLQERGGTSLSQALPQHFCVTHDSIENEGEVAYPPDLSLALCQMLTGRWLGEYVPNDWTIWRDDLLQSPASGISPAI